MQKKIQAAVYRGNGILRLEARNLPPVGPADVRLGVAASGICGTDIHILREEYSSSPPVVLGHEFAGTVLEVGDQVSHVREGDNVAVEPHIYCGICKYCRDGGEHLCINKQAFGVHLDGGFAEQVVVPARNAYRLPPELDLRLGALAEPLGCCIHGVDSAAIKLGGNVAIFGAGFIGLLLAQLARGAGAGRIMMVEPNSRRRSLAQQYGADIVVAPEEAREAILDLSDGYKMDVVFDATGIPRVIEQALAATGRGGTLMVFGVAPPGELISVSAYEIFREEITIKGSLTNPYAHRRALALLPKLNLRELVTHTFPLEDIEAALQAAREGAGLKIMVTP
ncbi:MAG: zinc-dependent alcohol dehydrogenase family protein [Desulfobacterales bacterium]|nr:MAG: zinc-dependent alcohol dehydrogenase family protein [Desulfobacterales bacterium]